MPSEEQVRAVKRRHSMNLLQRPGIHGVGVEKDEGGGFVLAVHVDAAKAAADLPKSIEGCPVKIIHDGPFTKQT